MSARVYNYEQQLLFLESGKRIHKVTDDITKKWKKN